MARPQSGKQSSFLLLIVWLAGVHVLLGCNRETAPHQLSSTPPLKLMVIDNIEIPVLPTAAEQLSYASSNFADLATKRGALKAVTEWHQPTGREHRLAALELAYLELGDDYRLAEPAQYQRALANYGTIVATYQDDAPVAANALWHQGWVLGTLRGDYSASVPIFQQIITVYPEAEVENFPPPPWLSLAGTTEQTQPPQQTMKLRWADLARLELVRTSPDGATGAALIESLQEQSPNNPLLGLMIRSLLEFHGNSAQATQLATVYLERIATEELTENSKHLAADLRDLLTLGAPNKDKEPAARQEDQP